MFGILYRSSDHFLCSHLTSESSNPILINTHHRTGHTRFAYSFDGRSFRQFSGTRNLSLPSVRNHRSTNDIPGSILDALSNDPNQATLICFLKEARFYSRTRRLYNQNLTPSNFREYLGLHDRQRPLLRGYVPSNYRNSIRNRTIISINQRLASMSTSPLPRIPV